MNLADIVFIVLTVIVLAGALCAVALKNVFHNALSLILCLFGVAGLFIYLNSEFLAIMEVIIYIGAISIAIIFAIMLSQPMFQKQEKRNPFKMFKSFVVAAFLFAGILYTLKNTQWPVADIEGDYSMKALGNAFLTTQVLSFEVVSIVLLVAIIGALTLLTIKDKKA